MNKECHAYPLVRKQWKFVVVLRYTRPTYFAGFIFFWHFVLFPLAHFAKYPDWWVLSLTCAALWLHFLCQPLQSDFEYAYVLCFVLGAPEAKYQTTTSTKRDFIHTLHSFLSTQGEWKEAAAGEPPVRMFLMGGRESSNRKVTEILEAFLSTQPTRKTAKMTPNKGGNYGAGTESSSTKSRVSIRLSLSTKDCC